MSIIKMKRVSVIGIDTMKDNLVKDLMDIGVVQLTEEKIKKNENEESLKDNNSVMEVEVDSAKVQELEMKISDVNRAIETLETYNPEKQPLFITRTPMREQDFNSIIKSKSWIENDIEGVLKLRDKLNRLQEDTNKKKSQLISLVPWDAYDIPLNVKETRYTEVSLGLVPSTTDLVEFKNEIEEVSEEVLLHKINADRDYIYIAMITMKEDSEQVHDVLRQYGFTALDFTTFDCTVKSAEKKLKKMILDNEKSMREIRIEIASQHKKLHTIHCLYEELIMERDRELVRNKLKGTKRTFRLEGWVPITVINSVKNVLDDSECYYTITEPEEDDEVPVLLKNSGFATPFESVTEMYSLPAYRGIDPTSWFSAFYAIFFGMMLSDAGYGILISVVTAVVLRKYDIEGMTRKMFKMFFFCGISTIFWGAMFGGWFGDFVHVAGKTIFNVNVNIPPIWFNPIEDPTKLLVFSLAIGIVHMFLGMGINAGMLIKDGKWVDAFCDVFSWYMVIGGAIGYLVTKASLAMYIMIAGFAILLLTGGRKNKGLGKIAGGLGAVYGFTGYLSDILSYARLLALGLATGVIAQVINTIGSLAGGGIKGTIVLIVVFVIGHIFNLMINALGAFVHTSRLQYIEFFGKFYEDGGEPFDPFHKNTKYIRFTENVMDGGK